MLSRNVNNNRGRRWTLDVNIAHLIMPPPVGPLLRLNYHRPLIKLRLISSLGFCCFFFHIFFFRGFLVNFTRCESREDAQIAPNSLP
jgi:hypothetical protein